MENYGQKYYEALERARKLQENSNGMILKKWLWNIFPELKESEDERIRKEIISALKYANHKGVYDKHIAWLEKQGGNLVKNGHTDNKDFIKYADKYSHEIWHKLMDNFKNIKDYHIGCNDVSDIVLNAIIDTCNWLEKKGEKPQGKSALDEIKEEVGNQNCVKGDGKVEPKFHEGDWLVNNETCDYLKVIRDDGDWLENIETCGYLKVIEVINNNTYKLLNQKGEQFYIQRGVAEDNCHKFTINDANDGDVLVDVYGNIGIYQTKCTTFDWTSYCHLGRYGRFLSFKAAHANDSTYPATKEQRDLLFQEMRKEGYKWDAKKKVLKKSQRMISAEAKEALYCNGTCNVVS